jgi:uncharacterized membrane protein YeaQ/YmgE (transglycosylase-associated protein family)
MDSTIHVNNFIWFLVVGGLAGWLASSFVVGRGLGIIGDIVVGILGAFLGGFIANMLGFYVYGFWGVLGVAIVGSIILLAITRIGNFRRHFVRR